MPPAPNWRSPADYAYLNELTPACLAWEFLRRNPRYIKDYQKTLRQSGNEAAAEAIARRWGLPFPLDPALGADMAPVVWRPHHDRMSVLLARAPANFRGRSVRVIVPEFQRRARDGQYWLIGKVRARMTVILTEGATATSRVAAVIPFDADFARRTEAMLRLRHMLDGKSRLPPHDRLTPLGREGFLLKLRALDEGLAGETYRSIAQVRWPRTLKGEAGRLTICGPASSVW